MSFDRAQLPEPQAYFEGEGLKLSARGKWRTSACISIKPHICDPEPTPACAKVVFSALALKLSEEGESWEWSVGIFPLGLIPMRCCAQGAKQSWWVANLTH